MSSLSIHKRLNFNFEKQKLVLDTSRSLFSYAGIDQGTKELLNSLRKNSLINYQKVLDLGCGYGVAGLFVKKLYPTCEVVSSDRDSRAVEFTNHNAKLNGLNISTTASLDFEKIASRFNLIICNFPAKLEKQGLLHFISASSSHLEDSGVLALVVVKELSLPFEEIISGLNSKEEIAKLIFKDSSKGYSIYHIKFKKEILPVENPYLIKKSFFNIGKRVYPLLTSPALREFDTPHFTTELIISLMQQLTAKNIAFINPGQGHSSILANKLFSPERIYLVSPDLLQLRVCSENLVTQGYKRFEEMNTDVFEKGSDLLVWSILDEDATEIVGKLKSYKKNNAQILLAGRTNLLKRVLKFSKTECKNEIKKGKYSAILI